MTPQDLSLVCACNDLPTLQRNLLASDMCRQALHVHVLFAGETAARAYNKALKMARTPVVIIAHQDVYFPPSWMDHLAEAVDWLDQNDPDWAVLAPFGMVGDQHIGSVYSTSLSARVGTPTATPVLVDSIDELVIILRRDSGLRFDERLPDWHLFGTDIVQAARAAGKGAWVAHLPLVHNDSFHANLGRGFGRAYRAMRRKWAARLPIRTPVLWLRWHGLDLAWFRLRAWRSARKRRKKAGDTATDPKVFSALCGWEGSQ